MEREWRKRQRERIERMEKETKREREWRKRQREREDGERNKERE